MLSIDFAKGFSIVEFVVAIGIVALIGAAGLAGFSAWRAAGEAETAQKKIIADLRQAQIFAQASLQNSGWGVKIQSGQITLFKGASYAARDAAQDQSDSLPASVAVTGVTEIVFGAFSGIPATYGTITIAGANGQKQINVNQKGVLLY